ncbi:hypothetical protein MNBD_GAMMA21-1501 [hydrothermal vent metagenome]|uniref:Uncharacterized protein n=1 Tax=hydrothermal vent metagenome TaxID=652676 RepID=A0A3B0ZPX3_9ZZZZ
MSELTGSHKDNTTYVLKELFGITCGKPDDKVAEKLATVIMSLESCSTAIGLVPQTGALAPTKIVDILVGMARQLRNGNVSLLCKEGIKAKWLRVMSLACMGL